MYSQLRTENKNKAIYPQIFPAEAIPHFRAILLTMENFMVQANQITVFLRLRPINNRF